MSLVDWYSDHQEDSQTPKASASRICAEFPSCVNTEVHRRFRNYFPNRDDGRKKKDLRNRSKTNTKQDSGLSFFIAGAEPFRENIDKSSQDIKQKVQNQNSNAAIPIATAKRFTNSRNRIEIKFKHFADPEEVLSEYINVHIYNRSRLGRVDKKKIYASVIALHNIQKEAFAGFNETEANKSMNIVRPSETFYDKEKSSTNTLRSEKRLPTIKILERTMATSDLIFEFRPLDALNSQNSKNSKIPVHEGRRDLQVRFNAGPALSSSVNTASNKSISLLPKLNSTELRLMNVDIAETKNFIGKTVLPDIPRGKNPGLRKKEIRQSTVARRKPRPDINVQAMDVRSNWHLLKQERNWTQGKVRMNSEHTKQLHNTLERMSSEICEMQNPYLEKNSLHKGECKPLDEDARIFRNMEPSSSRKEVNKKTTSSKYSDKRIQGQKGFGKSMLKSKHGDSISKAPMKSTSSLKSRSELNLRDQKKDERTALKSEVEKYLEKYSLKLDKKMRNSPKEEKLSSPSSKVVAEMLAKLNIYDVGFHIDEKEKKAPVNAATSPGKCEDSTQILVSDTSNASPVCRMIASQDQNISIKDVKQSYKFEDVAQRKVPGIQSEVIRDEGRKLCTVKQSNGTNQTDKVAMKNKNNAFVKMSLKSLEGQIPKHLCPQILRSDFLNKYLSLNHEQFFHSALNFQNSLNSGRK